MKRIINPCVCDVGGKIPANAYVCIEYEEKKGRLSLCGVVGPTSGGNCTGGAGQCIDEIREGKPTEKWDADMLRRLCDIWDRWHLNDMRAACEHQRQLRWEEMAGEEIILRHYRLKADANKKKKDAEGAALSALRKGETFTPTEEQAFFAGLEYAADIYGEISDKLASYYDPKKPLYPGDCGPTEKKRRGWVRIEESPDGILCKPCPVCGYKYGTSWLKEDVPQDVLVWLFSLPVSERLPAWV